jgi:hypothetical protein
VNAAQLSPSRAFASIRFLSAPFEKVDNDGDLVPFKGLRTAREGARNNSAPRSARGSDRVDQSGDREGGRDKTGSISARNRSGETLGQRQSSRFLWRPPSRSLMEPASDPAPSAGLDCQAPLRALTRIRPSNNLISRHLSIAVFCLFVLAPGAFAQLIDTFESLSAWSAHPSDGVTLAISQGEGRRARAMRLDFDFHGHAGYAIARRNVDLDLPPNYEITFWMRADAPVNNLELKLIDATGENIWWMNRRDFAFPGQWTEVSTKKRQISFAWGPIGGGEPHHIAAMEIVVTAGSGGHGTVWVDDLELVPLPPPQTGPVTRGAWHADEGARQRTIDLGVLREIGGLRIRWDANDWARDFDVELSRDGERFEPVRTVVGNGRRDELIYLPDQEARAVRLSLRRSSRGQGYAIESVEVEPVEWAPTPNDFFAIVARVARPGDYPRYLIGQQPYWTVVGADGAGAVALVGEDGAVEPFKSGFSIEPFLGVDGSLITWSDVVARQSLAEGDLPIPSVTWEVGGISLTITAAVTESSRLLLRYHVRSEKAANVTLFLAIRPLQVNPSTQFLNAPGGVSPIHEIAFDGDSVSVNGTMRVDTVTRPANFGAAAYDEGDIVDCLRRSLEPRTSCFSGQPHSPVVHVTDPVGYASAVMAYPIRLEAGQARDIDLAAPLRSGSGIVAPRHPEPPAPRGREAGWERQRTAKDLLRRNQFHAEARRRGEGKTTESGYDDARVAAEWREKLHRVAIDMPGAPEIADTIRTNLAYILIQREGPELRPGSRSYERSWIRDGALISSALLRLGHADEAKAFAEWFAGHQFENGKVPCCVDRRGADPVPENDSHGELIFLVAEIHRYTHDDAFVRRLWPHVDAAARYIDELRRQNHGAFEGLVTESISHEGYSAKPVHSYWDDFFALKGLEDAGQLAAALGLDSRQRELASSAAAFRRDFAASIQRTIDEHGIDYIPGSAELGDFDPSATAIAISPLGLSSLLPSRELEHTFDRYFESIARPRSEYTPYEMRIIGALIRLGRKASALELVDRFLRDRRPVAWNEWAEVVGRDLRQPRFIGDMPHAWIASDFIRSILDCFAYDREDGAVVIGAGVPRRWIEAGTLHVGPLPTYNGSVDIRMRAISGDRIEIDLSGDVRGRLIVRSPDDRPIRAATIDEQSAEHSDGEIVVTRLPARVVLEYSGGDR